MIPSEEIILSIKLKIDPNLIKLLEYKGVSVSEWLRVEYIDPFLEEFLEEGDEWSWEYGTGM